MKIKLIATCVLSLDVGVYFRIRVGQCCIMLNSLAQSHQTSIDLANVQCLEYAHQSSNENDTAQTEILYVESHSHHHFFVAFDVNDSLMPSKYNQGQLSRLIILNEPSVLKRIQQQQTS